MKVLYCKLDLSKSVPGGARKVFHPPNSSKDNEEGSRELPEDIQEDNVKVKEVKKNGENKTKAKVERCKR